MEADLLLEEMELDFLTMANKTFEIKKGEKIKLDINNDGIKDIEIGVEDIYNDKKTKITLKEIEETDLGIKNSNQKIMISAIVIAIIISVAIIRHFIKRKRKIERKETMNKLLRF